MTQPVDPKPIVATTSTITTRVHAGVALVTIGGVALAAFGFFWFNLLRFNTETAPSPKQQTITKQESKEDKVAKLSRELFAPGANPLNQATVVAERKVALLDLAKENPAAAQNVVISSSAAENLSESVQAGLEKEVDISGQLEAVIGEDLSAKTSRIHLAIVQNGVRSNFYAPNPESYIKLAGKSFTGRGFQLDGQNILLGAGGTDTTTTATTDTTTATTTAANTRQVAIILFNFANDASQPITADAARSAIFSASNSVSNFDKDASYNLIGLGGKIRTDGDVLGYFTLPSTYNSSTQVCSDYYRTWSDAARQAATTAGNDLSGYNNYVYVFPRPATACPGWAWAEITGDEVWLNDTKTPTIAHELGHNFGLTHSSGYICKDAAGAPTTLSSSCTLDEYGDPFDAMGSNYYQFNNAAKFDIGWLAPANVQDVTTSGTYTLSPIEKSATSIQGIRIPHTKTSTGQVVENYWLEYRQPSGFDTFASTDPVANGVTFRLAHTAYVNTWNKLLLDMNPSTSTFADAPLAVGQSFTDTVNGITIQTVDATADHATVNITFAGPVCTKAAPTATMTAASGIYGTSGQGLVYYLNVTNNDSSACPTSTFTVTPTLPTGFTQTPSPVTFTLAPGGFKQTALTVTSDPTSVADVYPFTELVTNTTTGLSAITGNSYTVTGQDTAAPKVTISSPKNGAVLRGKTQNVSASASDASGIAKMEIVVDGTVKQTCTTTTSCSYTIQLSTLTTGSHTIAVRATDKSVNANIGTTSVNVTKK